MLEITSEPEVRVRAWLLFNVRYPEFVAGRIHGALGTRGGAGYVVVRADVVTGDGYNVVVPVDAQDECTLAEVIVVIMEKARELDPDVSYPNVLRVKVEGYHPWPPHDAHCYITQQEYDKGQYSVDFHVGRNPQSPGSNAWG